MDFFKQYVTEDFTTYLNRKRMENCHGNHIEMQALSELYNRPIEVYQSGRSERCLSTHPSLHRPLHSILYLIYFLDCCFGKSIELILIFIL